MLQSSIDSPKLSASSARFQKLSRAIEQRSLKRALRFFLETSMQRELPNKKVGSAKLLTVFFGVCVCCGGNQSGLRGLA